MQLTFTVASGGSSISFTAGVSIVSPAGSNWLELISPIIGVTPATVTVQIDPSQLPMTAGCTVGGPGSCGVYLGYLVITEGTGTGPQFFPIELFVSPSGTFLANPATVSLTASTEPVTDTSVVVTDIEGPATFSLLPTTKEMLQSCNIPVTYSTSSNPMCAWLSVQATNYWTTSSNLSIKANPNGLAPGQYLGFVNLADINLQGNATVNVILTVPAVTNYTLTVSEMGQGTVTGGEINCTNNNTGTCSASYASQSQVILTATPSPGWTFTGWSGACSGTSACSITMTNNMTVTVNFTQIPQYTLTVSDVGPGTVSTKDGQISCTNGAGRCQASYASGAAVILNAQPASGSAFTGWNDACSGNSLSCSVTMSSDLAVFASFAQLYTLTVSMIGQGTITSVDGNIKCTNGGPICTASYPSGAMVKLNETPATGWTFTGWDNSCGANSSCSITISGTQTVTATFVSTLTQTFTVKLATAGQIEPFAANAIVSAYGSNLAASTVTATAVPLLTSLDGTTVAVTDSAGNNRLAELFYVSPTQVTLSYLMVWRWGRRRSKLPTQIAPYRPQAYRSVQSRRAYLR